jgi:hypothetical protein
MLGLRKPRRFRQLRSSRWHPHAPGLSDVPARAWSRKMFWVLEMAFLRWSTGFSSLHIAAEEIPPGIARHIRDRDFYETGKD